MPTFEMHSATLTVNGKTFDVRDVVMKYGDSNDLKFRDIPKLENITVSIPFKLTYWAGIGWQYKLRQLHLSLARYTTWPYIN